MADIKNISKILILMQEKAGALEKNVLDKNQRGIENTRKELLKLQNALKEQVS